MFRHLYTLSSKESSRNLSFSSFGDKTCINYFWVSLITSESEDGLKKKINWFNFQLRVNTIGCETYQR